MPSNIKTELVNIDAAGNIGINAVNQVGVASRKHLQTACINIDESGNLGVFLPEGSIPSAPGTGTSDHASLTNRDAPAQHPASAIAAVDGKSVQEHIDGLAAVVSGTYAEIKALRDLSQLIPGNLYRITNYETIYVQPVSNEVRTDSSALFDIVLLATDKNRFAPEAWAAHTARTQPAGSVITSTTPLQQWRLLYDIDNNSALYAWATSTGKGVIYRLIDHLENDLPYDFYNVKYRRYKITATTTPAVSLVGQYLAATTTKVGFTVDTGDYIDRLTFDWTQSIRCNKFSQWISTNGAKSLLRSTFGGICHHNTFGSNCYGNTFGGNCGYNTFSNNCNDNTFGGNCSYNTFGGTCHSNIFGLESISNTFGSNCHNNVFNSYFRNNTFGNDCHSNTFNGQCFYNTFSNSCHSNTFGASTLQYARFADNINSKNFTASNIYNKTENQTIHRNAGDTFVRGWVNASNIYEIANI